MSSFTTGVMTGTYWAVGGFTGHYRPTAPKGYSEILVAERIANIRTDLDAFSEAESSVLENHGYLLADAAISVHAPTLVAEPAPLAIPNPRWMDEDKVRTALKDSSKRELPIGRL